MKALFVRGATPVALAAALAIAALSAPAPATADTDATKQAVEKLRHLAKTQNKVQDHLKTLCKEVGPRLTGSDGINRSYEWTKAQFEKWGLDARLEKWGEWDVGFNRGPWSGKIITSKGEKAFSKLDFHTHAWTAGTNGPTRGRAIFAPKTADELAAKKGELKGAWVLQQTGGRRRRMSQEERELRRDIQAAGIAGWVRGSRNDLLITAGSPRGITMDNLPTTPQVQFTKTKFAEIVALVESGEKVELELDIQNEFKPGPYEHYNVIADIPGSEKPDEYVIVGGHIDGWDGAEATCDNGTGVSTTLEAARLIMEAGIKPKRTIRFMLWSGEEQGLLGSRAWVQAHRDLMPKISAVLVHDGGTNVLSGIVATEAMLDQMKEAMAPLVDDGSGFDFKVRQVAGLRGGGSDHNSFLAAGVPGFFWNQSGKANYNHVHHTQHDNFEEAVPEYQERSAFVVAAGALGIANLPELLNRENMQAARRQRKVLGVQLDGMTITSVTPGSRAEKGGFKVGDKFLTGAGEKVESLDDLRAVIQAAEGKTPFVVERGGHPVTLIAEFPEPQKKAEAKPKKKKLKLY